LPVPISPLVLGFLIPGDDQYRALVLQKYSEKLDRFDVSREEHLGGSEVRVPEEYHILDDDEKNIQFDPVIVQITDAILLTSQIRDVDEYEQWTLKSSDSPKRSEEVEGSDLGSLHEDMFEPLFDELRDHLAKALDVPLTDEVIPLQHLASSSEDPSDIARLGCFKPNEQSEMTILEMLEISPIHKKLYTLVAQDKNLLALLSQKDKSITLFAPTDKAFDRVAKYISDKELTGIILYHISPNFYSSRDLFGSRTLPTMYEVNGLFLRLQVYVGLQGLTLNLHSNVRCTGAQAKNGVIYTVSSVIKPPLVIKEVMEKYPEVSSVFLHSAYKTGLVDKLKGTVFMPTNRAFALLPWKVRRFLFSKSGEECLKKIIEYHIIPNEVVYTDAFVQIKSNRHYHIDVQTLLKDRTMSIDVYRFSRFLDVKVNGASIVGDTDYVGQNGVTHFVRSVILPPKKLNDHCKAQVEMTVECLMNAFGQDEELSTWDENEEIY